MSKSSTKSRRPLDLNRYTIEDLAYLVNKVNGVEYPTFSLFIKYQSDDGSYRYFNRNFSREYLEKMYRDFVVGYLDELADYIVDKSTDSNLLKDIRKEATKVLEIFPDDNISDTEFKEKLLSKEFLDQFDKLLAIVPKEATSIERLAVNIFRFEVESKERADVDKRIIEEQKAKESSAVDLSEKEGGTILPERTVPESITDGDIDLASSKPSSPISKTLERYYSNSAVEVQSRYDLRESIGKKAEERSEEEALPKAPDTGEIAAKEKPQSLNDLVKDVFTSYLTQQQKEIEEAEKSGAESKKVTSGIKTVESAVFKESVVKFSKDSKDTKPSKFAKDNGYKRPFYSPVFDRQGKLLHGIIVEREKPLSEKIPDSEKVNVNVTIPIADRKEDHDRSWNNVAWIHVNDTGSDGVTRALQIKVKYNYATREVQIDPEPYEKIVGEKGKGVQYNKISWDKLSDLEKAKIARMNVVATVLKVPEKEIEKVVKKEEAKKDITVEHSKTTEVELSSNIKKIPKEELLTATKSPEIKSETVEIQPAPPKIKPAMPKKSPPLTPQKEKEKREKEISDFKKELSENVEKAKEDAKNNSLVDDKKTDYKADPKIKFTLPDFDSLKKDKYKFDSKIESKLEDYENKFKDDIAKQEEKLKKAEENTRKAKEDLKRAEREAKTVRGGTSIKENNFEKIKAKKEKGNRAVPRFAEKRPGLADETYEVVDNVEAIEEEKRQKEAELERFRGDLVAKMVIEKTLRVLNNNFAEEIKDPKTGLKAVSPVRQTAKMFEVLNLATDPITFGTLKNLFSTSDKIIGEIINGIEAAKKESLDLNDPEAIKSKIVQIEKDIESHIGSIAKDAVHDKPYDKNLWQERLGLMKDAFTRAQETGIGIQEGSKRDKKGNLTKKAQAARKNDPRLTSVDKNAVEYSAKMINEMQVQQLLKERARNIALAEFYEKLAQEQSVLNLQTEDLEGKRVKGLLVQVENKKQQASVFEKLQYSDGEKQGRLSSLITPDFLYKGISKIEEGIKVTEVVRNPDEEIQKLIESNEQYKTKLNSARKKFASSYDKLLEPEKSSLSAKVKDEFTTAKVNLGQEDIALLDKAGEVRKGKKDNKKMAELSEDDYIKVDAAKLLEILNQKYKEYEYLVGERNSAMKSSELGSEKLLKEQITNEYVSNLKQKEDEMDRLVGLVAKKEKEEQEIKKKSDQEGKSNEVENVGLKNDLIILLSIEAFFDHVSKQMDEGEGVGNVRIQNALRTAYGISGLKAEGFLAVQFKRDDYAKEIAAIKTMNAEEITKHGIIKNRNITQKIGEIIAKSGGAYIAQPSIISALRDVQSAAIQVANANEKSLSGTGQRPLSINKNTQKYSEVLANAIRSSQGEKVEAPKAQEEKKSENKIAALAKKMESKNVPQQKELEKLELERKAREQKLEKLRKQKEQEAKNKADKEWQNKKDKTTAKELTAEGKKFKLPDYTDIKKSPKKIKKPQVNEVEEKKKLDEIARNNNLAAFYNAVSQRQMQSNFAVAEQVQSLLDGSLEKEKSVNVKPGDDDYYTKKLSSLENDHENLSVSITKLQRQYKAENIAGIEIANDPAKAAENIDAQLAASEELLKSSLQSFQSSCDKLSSDERQKLIGDVNSELGRKGFEPVSLILSEEERPEPKFDLGSDQKRLESVDLEELKRNLDSAYKKYVSLVRKISQAMEVNLLSDLSKTSAASKELNKVSQEDLNKLEELERQIGALFAAVNQKTIIPNVQNNDNQKNDNKTPLPKPEEKEIDNAKQELINALKVNKYLEKLTKLEFGDVSEQMIASREMNLSDFLSEQNNVTSENLTRDFWSLDSDKMREAASKVSIENIEITEDDLSKIEDSRKAIGETRQKSTEYIKQLSFVPAEIVYSGNDFRLKLEVDFINKNIKAVKKESKAAREESKREYAEKIKANIDSEREKLGPEFREHFMESGSPQEKFEKIKSAKEEVVNEYKKRYSDKLKEKDVTSESLIQDLAIFMAIDKQLDELSKEVEKLLVVKENKKEDEAEGKQNSEVVLSKKLIETKQQLADHIGKIELSLREKGLSELLINWQEEEKDEVKESPINKLKNTIRAVYRELKEYENQIEDFRGEKDTADELAGDVSSVIRDSIFKTIKLLADKQKQLPTKQKDQESKIKLDTIIETILEDVEEPEQLRNDINKVINLAEDYRKSNDNFTEQNFAAHLVDKLGLKKMQNLLQLTTFPGMLPNIPNRDVLKAAFLVQLKKSEELDKKSFDFEVDEPDVTKKDVLEQPELPEALVLNVANLETIVTLSKEQETSVEDVNQMVSSLSTPKDLGYGEIIESFKEGEAYQKDEETGDMIIESVNKKFLKEIDDILTEKNSAKMDQLGKALDADKSQLFDLPKIAVKNGNYVSAVYLISQGVFNPTSLSSYEQVTKKDEYVKVMKEMIDNRVQNNIGSDQIKKDLNDSLAYMAKADKASVLKELGKKNNYKEVIKEIQNGDVKEAVKPKNKTTPPIENDKSPKASPQQPTAAALLSMQTKDGKSGGSRRN